MSRDFLTGLSGSRVRRIFSSQKSAKSDGETVLSSPVLCEIHSNGFKDTWADESSFGPLTVYRHRAMASDFEVAVNESDAAREEPFSAFDIVDQDEETLSVFRSSSILSRINLLAAEMNIPVSEDLFHRFLLCRRLWEETDGAFDITASALWRLWGFAKGEGRIPTSAEIDHAMENVGMEHITLDEKRLTVAFDRPGIEVNFGGIGKGMALDAVETFLGQTGISNYLVHGGMSSVLARGGRAGDKISLPSSGERPCWTIGIADPLNPDHRIAKLRLTDEAVGTGGSGRQYFFHEGKRLSHIIDPKTGYPAVGILSATVIAPTAAEADALSTAFFVMGAEKTEAYIQAHPEYRVLLILENNGEKPKLVTFNMEEKYFIF